MKDDVLMYNSNELNAAYAADGYARFRRGLGVLATTYVHRSFASRFHLQCRF
jgi:TPP-dependent 2-oxoacid decarboxylase